jgi:hypothetical protein
MDGLQQLSLETTRLHNGGVANSALLLLLASAADWKLLPKCCDIRRYVFPCSVCNRGAIPIIFISLYENGSIYINYSTI